MCSSDLESTEGECRGADLRDMVVMTVAVMIVACAIRSAVWGVRLLEPGNGLCANGVVGTHGRTR